LLVIQIYSTHSDTTELKSNTDTVFETTNIWFKNYYPSLNLKKNSLHSLED
jgi:hypothetical protein